MVPVQPAFYVLVWQRKEEHYAPEMTVSRSIAPAQKQLLVRDDSMALDELLLEFPQQI